MPKTLHIQIVVAAGLDNSIGFNNKMPWHLPNDLKFFKAKTLGHPVLMGSNTFASIGRPLPKRQNIIVSSKAKPSSEQVVYVNSIEAGIDLVKEQGESLLSIIGGGQIYQQTIHLAQTVWLTRVQATFAEATVFFPELNKEEWCLVSSEAHDADELHQYAYTFEQWVKK